MWKDYNYLAHCLAPIGEQIGMSHGEQVGMLKSWMRRILEEDIGNSGSRDMADTNSRQLLVLMVPFISTSCHTITF
jgi:hypothetical protein